MRNLIKKSLAFVLVAALALTCFVGTFSVSAADPFNANISVTANPVTLGDAEATAIINVAMVETNAGINEALIKVTSTIGAVAKEVELVKDADGTAYTTEELKALDYVADYSGEDIADYGHFYLSAKTATYAIPSAFIKVTFTVGADVTAGTYAINIDVPESKVIAATPDEVAVNFIYDNQNPVSFTVEEKVTHECVWGEIKYAVEDGNCVTYQECECGERNVILSVANVAVTPNPVLASGLAIRFRVKQNAVTGYTDLYGVFTKDTYSGATFAGESAPETIVAAAQGKNWQFEYTGIASYEMSCTIHIKVYGTDASGNVVLVASSDQSLADFFKGRLATSGKYTDANMNLYADILRYGSESQKAMGYNTDNLANAGVVTDYGSELPTSFTNTTSPSTGFTITPTVVVGNSVLFRIRFLKSEVASYDASTIRMTIDYTNSYGQADTIEATVADFTDASNGTRYQYEFSSLPASYINDYFAIKIYAGESTKPLATLDYCFQTYASTRYANASANATLCQAIVAYSNSAAIAFGVK